MQAHTALCRSPTRDVAERTCKVGCVVAGLAPPQPREAPMAEEPTRLQAGIAPTVAPQVRFRVCSLAAPQVPMAEEPAR